MKPLSKKQLDDLRVPPGNRLEALLWFATIQGIESKQDLGELAP